MHTTNINDTDIKQTVANWVESVVVDLNLCPFAKREIIKNRVRYALSEATDWDALVNDLESELTRLKQDEAVETTLLIHPKVLQDFFEYNEFLNVAFIPIIFKTIKKFIISISMTIFKKIIIFSK